MNDADLLALPATALAERIARGEIAAVRAVDACIGRIRAVNPALNAMVSFRFEAARAEAVRADHARERGALLGPLHGVPVTVKDAIDVAGLPSTFGLAKRRGSVAGADDVHVGRWRSAGAIVLGKTNVAQVLLAYESDNPVFGRTNNPWDLGRTSGGSSGGEAAIIAAGGSFLGLGTDIAGSVRVPAAFTGLAGLKPTAGRLPDAGRFSVPFGQQAVASQVGVLARTTADVALGLEVADGATGRAHEPQLEPWARLGDWQAVDLASLRVAVYEDDGTFPVSAAARRALHAGAAMLAARGARVSLWSPPDVRRAMGILLGVLSADGAKGLSEHLRGERLTPGLANLYRLMRAPRPLLALLERLGPLVNAPSLARAVLPHIGRRDTHHYWRLVEAQDDYRRSFARALDGAPGGPFDLIVTPGCALPALGHGEGANLGFIGGYSALFNLLGYPAGVVPVSRVRTDEERTRPRARDATLEAARRVDAGSAGLPVGVQVVARPWREHLVLSAMQAIETAAGGGADFPRTPRLPA